MVLRYAMDMNTHPLSVELCGICGRRVSYVGPHRRPYCERGGFDHPTQGGVIGYTRSGETPLSAADVAQLSAVGIRW